MKKIFFIFILALSFNAIAQESIKEQFLNLTVATLSEELMAEVVFKTANEEVNFDHYLLLLPEHYNSYNVKLAVKKYVQTYSDIVNSYPWIVIEDTNDIMKEIMIIPDKIEIVLFYMKSENLFVIFLKQ